MIGVSIAWQRGAEWLLASLLVLNPQAWMDWTWQYAGTPNYLPMVFYMTDSAWNDIGISKAQEFGGLWLLGNEPEMPSSFVDPLVAAEFSKKWQCEVGGEWAAPGIILNKKGYTWLQRYLDAGGLVGSHWQVHLYFVNTPDEWEATWNEFKEWMYANNLVRPVIVSETNGWDSSVRQESILDRIREIQMRDSLLHTVLWYSDLDWWEGPSHINMLKEDGSITEFGEHFVRMGHFSRYYFPLVLNQEFFAK